MISETELAEIKSRCANAQKGPWKSFIENRDYESGGHFIMTGTSDDRGNDIEMIGATVADYDFIAHARQDIPRLIQEIRELKFMLSKIK